MVFGQIDVSEGMRSPNLISSKRCDDCRAVGERDVVIGSDRPQALRKGHA